MKCLLLMILLSCGVSSFAFAAQPASAIHVVKKGETLYGISKKYETTEQELINLNPILKTHQLFVGEKLQLPSKNEMDAEATDASTKAKTNSATALKTSAAGEKKQPVLHEVLKGETTFSLSKRYNTKVDSILAWNHLGKPEIQVGQQIIVGFKSEGNLTSEKNEAQPNAPEIKNVTSIQNNTSANPAINATADANSKEQLSSHSAAPITSSAPVYHFNPNEGVPVTETGTADWIVNDDDSTNLFVLHRSAPVGTIMQITNLSNHKVVTAKVVGKLPGTSMNEPVLILVSDGVAHALGVSVEKFDVEINYSLNKQQ